MWLFPTLHRVGRYYIKNELLFTVYDCWTSPPEIPAEDVEALSQYRVTVQNPPLVRVLACLGLVLFLPITLLVYVCLKIFDAVYEWADSCEKILQNYCYKKESSLQDADIIEDYYIMIRQSRYDEYVKQLLAGKHEWQLTKEESDRIMRLAMEQATNSMIKDYAGFTK